MNRSEGLGVDVTDQTGFAGGFEFTLNLEALSKLAFIGGTSENCFSELS
jgi:hypothetical protein